MQCDVLVLGGGSAGLAAALGAARTGAETILVERHGMLGGMATAALVHSICGLYFLSPTPGAIFAHGGFPREFAERLISNGAAIRPERMGRVDVLLHSPQGFAATADDFVNNERSIRPMLHSEIVGVGMAAEGRRVEKVTVACRGNAETILAKAVVDATGDATATFLAGAGFEQSSPVNLQRPAYVFALAGVDCRVLEGEGRLALAHLLVAGVRDGDLTRGALGAAFRVGVDGEIFVTIDLDPPDGINFDPHGAGSLAGLEMEGRRISTALARFLRAKEPGFESSRICAFPARAGIRESRRVNGMQRLSAEDIDRGAAFEDRIALATWPMELRERTTGPRLRFPSVTRPCEIPLGCLRVAGVDNLFVAGRCISATHEAQASIRVIGTCMATGEAAGIAAALGVAGHLSADAVRARNGWAKTERVG